MLVRRMAAAALATASLAVTVGTPAQAQTAPVTVAVAGVITVSTPPAGAALVPPASLPGNATGSDVMVVTANTPYHVTVKGDAAKMRPWSGSAYTAGNLQGSLSVVPQVLVAGPTLTNVTLSTSDQTIASSTGGLADTYTVNMTQPVAASDPLGLYRVVLTYTVSAGL